MKFELPNSVKIVALDGSLIIENEKYDIHIFPSFIAVYSKKSLECIDLHSMGRVEYHSPNLPKGKSVYIHEKNSMKRLELNV